MILNIEDYNNNINPTAGDAVATGQSLFSGLPAVSTYYKNSNSFYFQRLLNYSSYNPNEGTTYIINFKKTVANTPTVFVVKDNKGIFNLAGPSVVN